MKKLALYTGLISATFALSACDSFNGANATTSGLNEKQVEEIVAQYIDENPAALISSLEKFQKQEIAKQQEDAKNAVKESRSQMLESKFSAVFGEVDSDNYVVEFFDYNCGYCKRAAPTLNKLIDDQDDLKVVFIELPVLGPSSEIAAAAALVVLQKHPKKYREFHNKMMEHKGKKELSIINQIARDLEIRDINFAEEIKEPEIAEAIEKNRALADKLGIRGTPAFVINDELVPGAVPYEQIVDILKQSKS